MNKIIYKMIFLLIIVYYKYHLILFKFIIIYLKYEFIKFKFKLNNFFNFVN